MGPKALGPIEPLPAPSGRAEQVGERGQLASGGTQLVVEAERLQGEDEAAERAEQWARRTPPGARKLAIEDRIRRGGSERLLSSDGPVAKAGHHRLMRTSPNGRGFVCSRFVHPTSHQSNPNLLVTGPVVPAGDRHAKVRRFEYRNGPVSEGCLDGGANRVVGE